MYIKKNLTAQVSQSRVIFFHIYTHKNPLKNSTTGDIPMKVILYIKGETVC